MKKTLAKNAKAIISVVIAFIICLGVQMASFAATTVKAKDFSVNFVDGKNYTLTYNDKVTNNKYVSFKVTSGATLDMWAAHYKSGIVLTETITVKSGDGYMKAYYKTGHDATIGQTLKARAQQSSKSGTHNAKG